MQKLLITTAIALNAIPVSLLAYSASDSSNLCHFATASVGGIRLSTLRNAVTNNNFNRLAPNGNNRLCNALYRVIKKGKFANTATPAQASDSSYDYYNLESQYCDTPTASRPLTKSDISKLVQYNKILMQAATGCQSTYYKAHILNTLANQSGSSAGGTSAPTQQPTSTGISQTSGSISNNNSGTTGSSYGSNTAGSNNSSSGDSGSSGDSSSTSNSTDSTSSTDTSSDSTSGTAKWGF